VKGRITQRGRVVPGEKEVIVVLNGGAPQNADCAIVAGDQCMPPIKASFQNTKREELADHATIAQTLSKAVLRFRGKGPEKKARQHFCVGSRTLF